MLNKIFLLIFLSLFIFSCNNEIIKPNYEKYKSEIGELNYRILFPKDFDRNKAYPFTIFLHGIGERGNDNELQLKYIEKVFLNPKKYNDYPSVVIFPQAPLNDNWSSRIMVENQEIRQVFPIDSKPTKSLQMVMRLIDSISEENYIDKKRIYLSGLSNGAMGSFELLKYRPDMFASAVLICGGGDPDWAKEFAKSTPIWIVHGSNDDIVHPSFSLEMAESVIKEGGSPKLTLYENVGHDSWFNVFSDPDYLKWMFSYIKN